LTGPGEDTRYLQMSTPVQHGNSGGPLLDMSGNVVGVVTSGLRGEYQNVNFAIRAPIVINFLLAKGVPPRLDMPNANQTLTPQKVARLAKEFTVQVYCETTSRKTSEAGPKPEDTNHILRRPGPPR